jgi:hypothetical protein
MTRPAVGKAGQSLNARGRILGKAHPLTLKPWKALAIQTKKSRMRKKLKQQLSVLNNFKTVSNLTEDSKKIEENPKPWKIKKTKKTPNGKEKNK